MGYTEQEQERLSKDTYVAVDIKTKQQILALEVTDEKCMIVKY